MWTIEILWTKGMSPPSFSALKGDIKTDVLVIGGGMAGVLCARKLHDAGVDYVLTEGKTIGDGATKKTTAVLTAQHDTLYQDMIKSFGLQKAGLYLQANLNAVKRFRALSQDIDCDFEEKPSIMYALHDRELMEREVEAVQQLGFGAEFTTETPMPFPVAGAVRYPGMGQVHPLKFLYQIAQGLNIFEHTFVEKLDGTVAVTNGGNIRANKVIIAAHYPFINSHGLYFMKLYQKRSHVIAFENAPALGCTIMDAAENGFYLRNYENLLVIGGGDHRTGKNGGSFQAVRAFVAQNFPGAREKYVWANQDCVSLDGVPYIGPYSAGLADVYVASGFNLWGMTTSLIAAEILTDMVLGRDNKYASAFTPDRSILHGQLFANIGATLVDFMSPTTKRCSHMGCALKWNAEEHSWDCSCHGSRFDEHGRLIDNPAMKSSRVE